MNRAATIALMPLSAIYRVATSARNSFYRRGAFHSHRVGVPVISVGNITTGGTGKTPLVEWIAKQLAQTGRRVCVLTRGYGRKTAGRVIVSDGHEVLAGVDEAGDEAFLLADNLRGQAAVICDANRVGAARWAIETFKINVFVLDDAFQHQRIARNLNILTIDATNPWGNGRLLPAGILREPRESLKRADCVLITRSDQSNRVAEIQSEIAAIRSDIPVFRSHMKLANLRSLDETSAKPQSPVAAFCGLANPAPFFAMLRNAAYDLVHVRTFRDHHNYTQNAIDRVTAAARAHGAQAIVTTAKDAVKVRSMKFALPCYVAEIEIEINLEDQFRQLILNTIKV